MVERKRFSAFTFVAIGRLRLVGAVGAPKSLDHGISFPAGLEEIVDAQAAVPGRELGMIGAPGAAGVREDEDALGIVHEGGGFGEVRRAGPVLDHQPVSLADHAARASRHLRHHLGSEPLHDLVERAGDRRERGELFDQAVAAGDRFAALDRLAVAIDGPGGEIALGVGERLVELHGEGMGEVVEHVLAGRDVDLDVVPVLGRDLREPALHQRFAGRDELETAAWPTSRSRSIERISEGVFIDVSR